MADDTHAIKALMKILRVLSALPPDSAREVFRRVRRFYHGR